MTLISPTYWGGMPFDYRSAPTDCEVTPLKLRAQDGRELRGLRYAPSGRRATAGAVLMHPRVDFTRHYAVPRLVDAGLTVLAMNSRNPNDDTDTVHEELVLDVGAAVEHLREAYERVVLIGNSGGGSLMALYQQQARASTEERIARAPSGQPTLLPRATLHTADLLVLLAAHRGEGQVLLRTLDPSVVDEADPSLEDPALDMYAPDNGFAEPPGPSRYDDGFVRRYSAAQRARVERLDALARALLRPARAARRARKAPGFGDRPFLERQAVERALHGRRVMVIYRTMANLAYTDPAFDPSPRAYGSLLSPRPDLMNRELIGFARTVTPRAWLSTWSGLSSNADLAQTLPDVAVPVLVIHAERDQEVLMEADLGAIRGALPADDSHVEVIEGAGHYFEPAFGETDAPHVEAAMDVMVDWLRARL